MPTIVETPGAANANSFVSLAEFDTYLSERLHVPTVVSSATDETKQKALIMATRLMNGLCYVGTPSSSTQSLKFPMTGLTTGGGFPLDSAIIPTELKTATMELAFLLIQSDRTLENSVMVAGLTKLKAGPVELGFKDDIKVNTIPDSVRSYLVSSWLCVETTRTGGKVMIEVM